ncbi:hypothetical protein QBB34_47740 [Streptomyces stelliscabiei]|uniref:hypothetical protein n=1 Tax=Streptomyces stelliscabiei TaxID=146820 RepID=UPI002FF2FF09
MHTETRRPVLLLGAGVREFHLHTFLQITAQYPTVLVDRALPDWARPYLAGFIAASPASLDEVVSRVGQFVMNRPMAGVLTYDAQRAELAAELARQLGLPGNAPRAVAVCEDPVGARQLLQAHGVANAPCDVTLEQESAAEAELALTTAGRRRVGSNEAAGEDHPVAFPSEPFKRYAGEGTEAGVTAVVLSPEDVRMVAVTRSDIWPEMACAPVGHLIESDDELLYDRTVGNLVRDAVAAVGLSLGIVHAQVRLAPSGPRMLRIGAHLADGVVSLLVNRALGIDLARVAVDLATGQTPEVSPTRKGAAAARFLYPPASGVPARVIPPGPSVLKKPWVDRFVSLPTTDGLVVGLPHSRAEDRLAYCVVTGGNAAICTTRLDAVFDQVSARIRPPADAPREA